MGSTNEHLAVIDQFEKRLKKESSSQRDLSEIVIGGDRLDYGAINTLSYGKAVALGFDISDLTEGRMHRFTAKDLHCALFGDEGLRMRAVPLLDSTMHFVETVESLPASGLAAMLLRDCLSDIMSMITQYLDHLPQNKEAPPIFERGSLRSY